MVEKQKQPRRWVIVQTQHAGLQVVQVPLHKYDKYPIDNIYTFDSEQRAFKKAAEKCVGIAELYTQQAEYFNQQELKAKTTKYCKNTVLDMDGKPFKG